MKQAFLVQEWRNACFIHLRENKREALEQSEKCRAVLKDKTSVSLSPDCESSACFSGIAAMSRADASSTRTRLSRPHPHGEKPGKVRLASPSQPRGDAPASPIGEESPASHCPAPDPHQRARSRSCHDASRA